MTQEIKAWTELSAKLLQKTKVFDLWVRRLKSPVDEYQDDFYQIRVIDWVNIIALTEDQQVVLVEQHRFGINQNTMELPGGMLDGPDDTPEEAAIRELTEETGYTANDIELLGMVHPNPAIQTNRSFSYFARDVKLVAEQNLDPAENIKVHLVPIADIPHLLESGIISHSLVVCAFLQFYRKYGPEFPLFHVP
jgi:8-oxo-dGTP pyrophosphatase MutT (NUDIX family)